MNFVLTHRYVYLIMLLIWSACTSNSGRPKKTPEATGTKIETRIFATSSFNAETDALEVELNFQDKNEGGEIMYFLHGDLENAYPYKDAILLKGSTPGMAMVYFEENPVTGSEVYFYKNKATGKPVEIITQLWPEKDGQKGRQSLTDGLLAAPVMDNENWVAFYNVPAGIKIDLDKIIPIEEICIRFLQVIENRIFLPTEILFSISQDDEEWIAHKTYLNRGSQEGSPVSIKEFSVPGHKVKARYIKIEATEPGLCPEWHPQKDSATYMYCDEVVVE